jgi:hypothetical protein
VPEIVTPPKPNVTSSGPLGESGFFCSFLGAVKLSGGVSNKKRREGRAAVIDVDHGGKLLSSAQTGTGVDIIDYDPQRGHLYVPAAKSATLTILGVSAGGKLSVLGTFPVASGSHCAVTDRDGHVFVGDPRGGRLLVIKDHFTGSM